jgi:hypothetical protein
MDEGVSIGEKAVEDLPRVRRPCLDDIDGAIIEKLNKHPFHSCRSLIENVCVAPSTVWKDLMESLGFSSRCLHWVPHELTNDLGDKRVAIGSRDSGGGSIHGFSSTSDWRRVLDLFIICT